mmetsp:Transcript_1480/g.3324  ORF Transcript_1480/g.3324 Transcript_1480/m.3324 type:complete len:93 (+) Transcript_1480:441-719(+)
MPPMASREVRARCVVVGSLPVGRFPSSSKSIFQQGSPDQQLDATNFQMLKPANQCRRFLQCAYFFPTLIVIHSTQTYSSRSGSTPSRLFKFF